jgi:hypothetical protein
MAEIDIGADTYSSFADEDFADTYIAADPAAADAWAALDQDGKNRLSVTSTRVLKRLSWIDGVPSFDDTPLVVQEATCEFNIALLNGYDLNTAPGSVLAVKRQKAGSVEVEYFRDLDNPAYVPPPLPQAVWELLKPMLVSPAGTDGLLGGAIAFGTGGCNNGETRLDRMYGFGPNDRDWN